MTMNPTCSKKKFHTARSNKKIISLRRTMTYDDHSVSFQAPALEATKVFPYLVLLELICSSEARSVSERHRPQTASRGVVKLLPPSPSNDRLDSGPGPRANGARMGASCHVASPSNAGRDGQAPAEDSEDAGGWGVAG